MEKRIEEMLKDKKILFATVAADGHVNPLTGLAKFLMSFGCDVRWYTSGSYSKKINDLGIPHFPYVHARDINGRNVDEVLPERKLITDAATRADFDMKHIFAEMAPGALADLWQIAEIFPFDIVVADSAFPAIPLIRAKLHVPVVAVGVIPLAQESQHLGPFGPGFIPPADEIEYHKFSELRDLFNNEIFKESINTFSAILKEHGIEHRRAHIFDTLIRHSDLYLQIGTPSFEYKRTDLGKNIRFIGPLLPYTDPEKHSRWFDERLNRYNHVVLVTQGTVESDAYKLLLPTLEALKNTDTLVIATTGNADPAPLQTQYPYDNIIIESYIPFAEIMPYVTVFVTNGGYSGTLLSISNRVPLVTAGLHEGKAEVCSRVGYFKCGIDLGTETPSPDMVSKAVQKVISNEIYKQNVSQLSKEMETYNAPWLCASYIAELLEQNYSHYLTATASSEK